MLSNDELERLRRWANIVPYLDREIQEKFLEMLRTLKAAEDRECGLPASAVEKMVEAVPDKLMADIVNDNRNGISKPGWIKPSQGQPVVRGTGWAKPANVERSKAQDEMFDA